MRAVVQLHYEMRQDFLGTSFTGEMISFDAYEDSNFFSDSGGAGRSFPALAWQPLASC